MTSVPCSILMSCIIKVHCIKTHWVHEGWMDKRERVCVCVCEGAVGQQMLTHVILISSRLCPLKRDEPVRKGEPEPN